MTAQSSSDRRHGTGRGTRLGIGLQVSLTAVLALGAVLLLNWLFGRPGWRERYDLTEKRINTLSTATLGVLGRLEDEVHLDVFYRPIPGPLSPLHAETMERVWRLLVLFSQESERIDVRAVDVSDPMALDQRRTELKLTGFENCIVVSQDGRRQVLRLSGDLAEFDVGVPDPRAFRPPSLLTFKAEESIVQGILSVISSGVPKLYFSRGHGERELYDLDDATMLGNLHTLLTEDGFDAGWWQYDVDGPVPQDAAALAILGPDAPFSPDELEAIHSYVALGGRLILAPESDPAAVETSGMISLLEHYGIELSRGIVCRPHFRDGQPTVGAQVNAGFAVLSDWMAAHPITSPLRESGRSLRITFPHRVRVARQPQNGASRPIAHSGPASWLEVDDPPDFAPDTSYEELRPHPILIASEYRGEELRGPVVALEEQPQSRLLVLGSADVFANAYVDYNADFARNCFNWAVDREYKVAVSQRDPDLRRVPIESTDALSRVTRSALWKLPGLCLLLGALTALLRSRGGRRPAKTPASGDPA